jgi:hypothetical protein
MFGYTMKTGYTNLAIVYFFFPPHFWRLKTSKITFFFFRILNFAFWRYIASKERPILKIMSKSATLMLEAGGSNTT